MPWTVGPQTLKPKRLTGRYEFTAEAAVSVIDLEQALRRDLADAVMSQASDQLLNGDYDATARPQEVAGFYARLAAPTDPTAEATYSNYAKTPASGVDGLHASAEEPKHPYCSATDVYQPCGRDHPNRLRRKRESRLSTAGAVPAWRAFTYRTGRHVRRTYRPATSSCMRQGPNGGAMRGDSDSRNVADL